MCVRGTALSKVTTGAAADTHNSTSPSQAHFLVNFSPDSDPSQMEEAMDESIMRYRSGEKEEKKRI